MTTPIKKWVLVAALGLPLAADLPAQSFTNLYSFTATPPYPGPYINSDGARPYAGLVVLNNTFYGTAFSGGDWGFGSVFAVNRDGTGFTNLYSFSGGSDGANPYGGLVLSSNTLYGTTEFGGDYNFGVVFAVNTDGTGFTNLHNFGNGDDGVWPTAGLISAGNTLYGTATGGGGAGYNGIVFAINTDGTGYTNVHKFNAYPVDGDPAAGLVLSGRTLFGTCNGSGGGGAGTVFKVNIDGTGFTNLHSFIFGAADGFGPLGGVVLSGDVLYGTAQSSSGAGAVFMVNTDGSGFTNLHNFTGGDDGGTPYAGLLLSGKSLYGTTFLGGSSGNGTVFRVSTNGTGFSVLYDFTASATSYPYPITNNDGALPIAGLLLSGDTLYGTTSAGGSSASGTIFGFLLPPSPQLTILRIAANVVLTWPTNAAGYTLQSTTNLALPPNWSTVTPGPVVVNGKNTVTNFISGTRHFYRLSQ